MPYTTRAYVAYIDDSGNEAVGWLFSALAIPLEYWNEYLDRWLNFRQWLYKKNAIPADFELHARAWLSGKPCDHTPQAQLDLVTDAEGKVPAILEHNRDARRSRFEVFEKALKTIGGYSEARLFTVLCADSSGAGRIALYDELLAFIQEALEPDKAHAMLIVDGDEDSGGHLWSAHRRLDIRNRRIIEDAALRRSSDSQLLQMVDACVHAAFQSVQNKVNLDAKFKTYYETALDRLIERPFGTDIGRCIRGHDYDP